MSDKNVQQIHYFEVQDENEDNTLGFSPFRRQLFAVMPTVIFGISCGMLYGYSATLLPELLKSDSDIQVSRESASWIASMVPLLIAVGCLVGGPIMEHYGRKTTQYIYSVLNFVGWVAICFAPNLTTLFIGRILGGFSGGVQVAMFAPFIGEVSEPKYRGFMLILPSLALAFGILATHFSGTFLSWRQTAIVAAAIPLISMMLLIFTPESPSWYISKSRYNDALRSFKWLRGNSEAARNEFDATWEQHKQNEINRKQNTKLWSKLTEAIQKPEFRKPFVIVATCFFVMQFSGPYIVAFYSVSILEKLLNSTINEYLVMNVIDCLRLGMVIVATCLLRISPRRILMIVSGAGTTLSSFGLAGYMYTLNYHPPLAAHSWIPITLLVSYIFFISIGIFVLPWCLAGELFSLEYRGLGVSLNGAINFSLFFIIIKIGPGLMEAFGVGGAFLMFGLVTLLGTVTLYFIMPETKNRTLIDIEKRFRSKRNDSLVINS